MQHQHDQRYERPDAEPAIGPQPVIQRAEGEAGDDHRGERQRPLLQLSARQQADDAQHHLRQPAPGAPRLAGLQLLHIPADIAAIDDVQRQHQENEHCEQRPQDRRRAPERSPLMRRDGGGGEIEETHFATSLFT